MADEQIQEEIKEEVVDDAQVKPDETPEVKLAEPTGNESEVEPEQESQETAPVSIEEEETPEEGREKRPSNRLLTRAQKLLEKYGPPEKRVAPSQRRDALDYQNALDADPQVIQQLEADRRAEGESRYNEGLQTANAIEFRTNIKLDLPLVKEKMEKLDPRDADALDREYLYAVGFDPGTGFVSNPNIGYAEFIDAKIEMGERLAQSMNANTVRNVARQAATTGLRPDGSSAKRLNLNQAPEDMTMEELYAKIGQKPPKKS